MAVQYGCDECGVDGRGEGGAEEKCVAIPFASPQERLSTVEEECRHARYGGQYAYSFASRGAVGVGYHRHYKCENRAYCGYGGGVDGVSVASTSDKQIPPAEDDEQGDDEDCAEVVEREPSDVAPVQSEWCEDYGRREQLQRKEHRGVGTTTQQRHIDREGDAEEDVRHGESYVVA